MLTTTAPRWRTDLTRDIRVDPNRFDHIGDAASYWPQHGVPYFPVTVSAREETTVSLADRAAIAVELPVHAAPVIVEIGVGFPPSFDRSATKLLIDHVKAQGGRYLGIDIADRASQVRAEAYDGATFLQVDTKASGTVAWVAEALAGRPIDFLFIDGDHSINGILADWELTALLAPHACVGFHDTAYHPGPYLFTRALNEARWHVLPNVIDDPDDWGVGFAWRR